MGLRRPIPSSGAALMVLALLLLTAFLVFAIAAVAVGRIVAETAPVARQSVFDLNEAVEYVADRLSPATQARLSHEDVRQVLGSQLDYLEDHGVAYERDDDRQGDGPGPNVIDDDRALGWVLGQATDAGLDLSDGDVLAVIDLGTAYLAEIGAIGGAVPEPGDLEDR